MMSSGDKVSLLVRLTSSCTSENVRQGSCHVRSHPGEGTLDFSVQTQQLLVLWLVHVCTLYTPTHINLSHSRGALMVVRHPVSTSPVTEEGPRSPGRILRHKLFS